MQSSRAIFSLARKTVVIAVVMVFSGCSNADHAWLRDVDTTIVEKKLGEIEEKLMPADTGWGSEPLLHSPIAFSSDYEKIRIFDVRNGSVRIHDGSGKTLHSSSYGIGAKITGVTVSPDLENYYYVVRTPNEKVKVVTDAYEGKEFDAVSKPVFSSDFRYLSYIGMDERSSIISGIPIVRTFTVVLNNQPLKFYSDVTADVSNNLNEGNPSTVFNPANNRLAYIINFLREGSFIQYENEKYGNFHEILSLPSFSANGNSWASIVRYGSDWGQNAYTVGAPSYVCDVTGVTSVKYKEVSFSENGKHCGVIATMRNGLDVVAVDGKTLTATGGLKNLGGIQVSDNGRASFQSYGDQTLQKGRKIFGPFEEKNGPAFLTRDSVPYFERAVETREGALKSIQIGNEIGEDFDDVRMPILDEEKRLPIYKAKLGKESYVVIGKTKIGPYDDVWNPILSNGKIVFGARKKADLFKISIDLQDL